MADGQLLVNFAALQQGVADINKAISTLQSQLDQLSRDAAPLVATWGGPAQQAYQERQSKWNAASQDLTQILQNIRGALQESAESYQSTERQATQRFQ